MRARARGGSGGLGLEAFVTRRELLDLDIRVVIALEIDERTRVRNREIRGERVERGLGERAAGARAAKGSTCNLHRQDPDGARGDESHMMAAMRRIGDQAIKIDLPNVTQLTDYTCGASALQAICSYFGVGPEEEADYERQMAMPVTGADPIHITSAAKRYGLEVQEYRPMTAAQLEACLDAGRPVILMLQAWGEGHYVVAIGYDDEVFYVEDPSIQGSRGFIERAELDARWHDVEGDDNHHTDHLGIAIWKDGPVTLPYARRARHVD